MKKYLEYLLSALITFSGELSIFPIQVCAVFKKCYKHFRETFLRIIESNEKFCGGGRYVNLAVILDVPNRHHVSSWRYWKLVDNIVVVIREFTLNFVVY